MWRETLRVALFAGVVASVVLTCAQWLWVTPLIKEAERYEQRAEPISASDESPHEWSPQPGWERTLFTFAANVLLGIGYAFVLLAAYLLWRPPDRALTGAFYGLAGFTAFFLAPALGLPPELPGTSAAALSIRQEWWIMTAAATAIGILMLFSQVRGSGRWWIRLIAVFVLIAPHLIAAPHPAVAGSLAPAALEGQFQISTAACNGLFWVTLGVASAIAFQRWVSGDARDRS